MAQHDYVFDNASGADIRTDFNNLLQAVLTMNSGATAPSTTAPYMFWQDTVTGTLKQRNAADTDWVVIFSTTGISSVGDGTGAQNFIINGAASNVREITLQSAGNDRWSMEANATAEGGSDAGSDFELTAYDDAGSEIDSPIVITRAALGLITFNRNLQDVVIGDGVAVAGGNIELSDTTLPQLSFHLYQPTGGIVAGESIGRIFFGGTESGVVETAGVAIIAQANETWGVGASGGELLTSGVAAGGQL